MNTLFALLPGGLIANKLTFIQASAEVLVTHSNVAFSLEFSMLLALLFAVKEKSVIC